MRSIKKIAAVLLANTFCICLLSFVSAAQSTDQNFPTAVTSNEIDGTIKARDIGDSRLTSYFYTFDGGQGDVFINVVTKNFTGDIDVFAVEGLRPLAKMVIYADGSVNETGRLVYMRKPERLILRIEGRSPNDDSATFRMKFAGSFVALAGQKSAEAPTIKGSEVNEESGVRVNSVGTIVEVLPKPLPPVKDKSVSTETVAAIKEKDKKSETAPKKPVVVATETTAGPVDKKPQPAKPPVKTPPAKESAKVVKKDTTPVGKAPNKVRAPEVKTVFKKSANPKEKAASEEKPIPTKHEAQAEKNVPDPMANIRLIVQLKDGKVIECPISEVAKFSVDNGLLTVIGKDGKTVKYSILDVAKVTIE